MWTYSPLIAALIGYLTKRVAIEMMFRPLEFAGIKPFFGRQGVIPANARRIATTAVDLLTRHVLDVNDMLIGAMVRDKSLTCRLIREVAAPEFKSPGH